MDLTRKAIQDLIDTRSIGDPTYHLSKFAQMAIRALEYYSGSDNKILQGHDHGKRAKDVLKVLEQEETYSDRTDGEEDY